MGFIGGSPVYRTIADIVIFIGAIVTPPFYFILLVLPLALVRQIAIWTAPILKPDLRAALSPESGLTVSDDFYSKPKRGVVGMHYTDRPINRHAVIRRLQEVIDSGKFPELQQSLHRHFGFFFWGKCDFSLEEHVKTYVKEGCKGELSETDLMQFQDHLCVRPWMKDRPFWEIWLFPQSPKVFSLRVHHCFSDGFGHLSLLNAISDNTGPLPITKGPSFLQIVGEFLSIPLYAYSHYRAFVDDMDSSVWIKRKEFRRDEVSSWESHSLPLETVKKAAKRHGLSLSEVAICAMTRAIRDSMIEAGEPVPRKMSSLYPFPRAGHSGGLTNHATMTAVKLPVGTSEREKIIAEVKKDFQMRKKTVALAHWYSWGFGLFQQFTKYLPTYFPYCTMAITTFALPKEPWQMFGGTVEKTSFHFEVSDHVPVASMFIGYRDKMFVWVKGRVDVFQGEERVRKMGETIHKEIMELAED